MPAHMAGPAGAKPPSTPTQARLQAENARLREVIDRISGLFNTDPFVLSRVELGLLIFQVRRVIDTLKIGTTDG